MQPLSLGVCIVAVGLQPSAQSRRRAQSAFAQGSSAPGRTRPTPLQVNVFSLSCGATPAAQQLSFRAQRRGRRARSTTLPRNALADSDKVAIAVPDVSAEAAKRLRRLELLVQLGRLYQKFVYAEKLLSDKSPFAKKEEKDQSGKAPPQVEEEDENDPKNLLDRVKEIEELQSTAAKIQAIYSWNGFPDKVAEVFDADQPARNGEQGKPSAESVRETLDVTVEQEFQKLTGRAASCLAALPYSSVEEARLSLEYEFLRQKQEAAEAENRLVTRLPKALGEKVERLEEKVERLGKSAKSTEAKLEEGWEGFKERPLAVLQGAASYGQGVWLRLNGGGRSMRKGAAAVLDTLPAARASKQEHEARMVSLALAAEEADKRFTEASKARENRLRKRDSTRLLLAQDIGELDAEVRKARVTLAVCQLAIEMERLFFALEEEAVEAGQEAAESPLSAQRSNDELSIFVAEFGALEAALARARALALRDQVLLLSDEELDDLARNVRDLTTRLGLSEEGLAAVGGDLSVGLLVEKTGRGAREALSKVGEGASFLGRGVRMLFTDLSASGRIFVRALLGSTLKPREVQTLRRTLLDVLSFIPFTVILLTPISPVGHVLVFGFIQKYLPGFFPSQFTSKRQELFQKFEELNAKLAAAEAAATEETLAAALKRAQEVVEALTREGAVDTQKLDMLAAFPDSEDALRDVYPDTERKISKRLTESSADKKRGM